MIKMIIQNEQIVVEKSAPPSGSWEEDWDPVMVITIEDKHPCYVMYRLDSKNSTGYDWVYISFSPDNAPVKQKMLYAATRATLKIQFGGGQVKDDYFVTSLDEVKLAGYKHFVKSKAAPPPLTASEAEMEMVKKTEVRGDISVDTKHQTLTGLAFPINEDAVDALEKLKKSSVNYVQLSLDLSNEKVLLSEASRIELQNLPSHFPTDHARYHFLRFKHTFEGDKLDSIVFIYSMPGYNCSIKERMLYSSCKGPLLDAIEQQMGLEIVRKLEIDNASELTEEYLYDELHPKVNINREQFSKPKGPGGRGPKRVTKD